MASHLRLLPPPAAHPYTARVRLILDTQLLHEHLHQDPEPDGSEPRFLSFLDCRHCQALAA